MKKINWIEEDYAIIGKIEDYTLFTIIEGGVSTYWLCVEIPITSLEQRYRDMEGSITISDKNKSILIEKAELMYKNFYETIQ